MANSGKDIQECMQKVAKLSMDFSLACMKNHPYVSFTLIFLLLLYLCFPWLFWLIIYLAGFLSLAALIAKIYPNFSNAKTSRTDDKKNDSNSTAHPRRLVRNDVNARSVRRRRSKEPSRDDSLQQTKEEEKTTVFSSTFDNVTVDKSALIEEHPKEIREVEVDSVSSRTERSTPDLWRSFRARKFDAIKALRELESSDSSEDERDKEENKKAVQWSEDDQKNLMDLGLSEIERNKRLESLIARRRARKLLSLQVRRTLMNLDRNSPFARINPIAVPRNNPFAANPSSGQFSPMPGSAPSVLIPMQNPFDLPYDPQEEKPILTGGSFHQEFLPVLQRDLFCRHESFNRGPYFPGEFNQEDKPDTPWFHDAATRQRSFECHEKSKLENQSDQKDMDKVIEVESYQPPKSNSDAAKDVIFVQDIQSTEMRLDSNIFHQEDDSEEVQTKLMLNDSSGHESSTTSSSEQDEPLSRIDRRAILESLASNVHKNNISASKNSRGEMDLDGSGLSTFDKKEMEDRYFFPHKITHHNPTCSVASDLQVEFSEISSPPLTIDGSFSSHDGEVPSSEENVDRGIPSSSEDTWAASCHSYSGVDENESRLRDIHEVREHNATEMGFSRTQSSEDPIAKQKMVEKMIEQGTNNPHSQSNPIAQLPDGSQEQTSSLNSSSPEIFQTFTGSDSSHGIPSETQAFPTLGKPPLRPQNGESDKPEQPSRSSLNYHGEFHAAYNANHSGILQQLNTKNLSHGEEDNGADILIREGGRSQTDWSMASSPTSTGYPESKSDIVEEHGNIFDYYQPLGENNNPRASEEFGGESINMPGHERMNHSMPVEEHGTPDSIQVDEQEQQMDQSSPEVSERFRSHQISQLLPHLLVQRIPVATIPFPSPRSVLQPKFSLDQRSLSNLSEDMVMEVQHFNRQIAENNGVNEPRGESLIYSVPHNTNLSMDDSASDRLLSTDAEISQESSNPSTTTTVDANFFSSNPSTTLTMEAKFTGSTSEYVTEANTESLTSPKSTVGLLKLEEETSSRISEEKHERSEELHEHEHEYGANSVALDLNKKMEELAGPPEVEKQQLLEPGDENNSGLENPHEAVVSGTDTAEDIKEVDPAIEAAENIRPNDHIVLEDTQEEKKLLKPPGSSTEEGTGLSKQA